MKKTYLFHTHILDLTGGSKSILNIAKGLNDQGHNVNIILEKEIVRYKIPDNINLYVITLKGIKKLKYNNFEDQNLSNTFLSKKQQFKNKVLNINLIRFLLIWLRYLFNLVQFPVKNYHMKIFLQNKNIDRVISSNMYSYLEHIFYYKNRVEKVFMSLRNSPVNVYQNRITAYILPLKYYYKNVTCIGVSEETTDEMKHFIDQINTKLVTIYNPFDIDAIIRKSKEKIDFEKDSFFVSVGGLNQRKRIDLTIRAYSQIKNKSIKLLLVGQGDKEKDLKLLVRQLNISERVVFIGSTDNPYKYMSKAKALVMTSESEGLPRVLIESLICETPTISVDCPTGPKEILIDELEELLVPISNSDETIVEKVREKMELILEKNIEINKGNLERFTYKNVIKKWELI
ncbi:glycosyltransferase [Tenacibaculum lutimaris]|nr:glycosyltransferase [Tenacibaculum lutimaris]